MKKSTNSIFLRAIFALFVAFSLSIVAVSGQQNYLNSPPPAFPPSNVSNTQDRDQMLWQLGVLIPTNLPLRVNDPNRPPDAYPGTPSNPEGADWTDSLGTGNTVVRTDWGLWNNYHDNKVGTYSPIYLLKMKDGTPVTTTDQWWNLRRPEIKKDVEEQLWGKIPPDSILPKIKWSVSVTRGGSGSSAYIQKTIIGFIDSSRYPAVRNKPRISAVLKIPANAKGRVPVMISIQNSDIFSNTSTQGWGSCSFNYSLLQPDNGAGLTSYIIGLCNKGNWRKPTDWGALAAWSWGISRLMDYFSTDPNVDTTKVGVTGHSRWGKGTIVSMAYDKRIFISYPSCAGSLGYKINRRQWGQNLENSGWDQEYHWMAGNLFKWVGPLYDGQYMPRKLENLPVDGYSLLSLCAPRPVFGNSGNSGDTWQDYEGAYLSILTAGPVWNLFGKKGLITNDPKPILDSAYLQGDIGFRWHHEGHTDAPDWPAFWRFAAKYVKVPYATISASSFTVTDTAKKATFTITSDTTWTITAPTWVTINPASGRLNSTVTLQIQRNLTNAARIDTVRISVPGLYDQKIAVNQGAQTLSVTPSILALADTANSKATFTITSDTTWTVAYAATTPWLTTNAASGNFSSTITLTAQANSTGVIRTDTVKISAPGLSTQKIVVNQGVSSPTFTVTLDATSVGASASKDTMRVTSNTVWSVTSSQTWATASVAGGKNNAKDVISISANTGVSSRTANITASAPEAVPQTFTITQAGVTPTATWFSLSTFSGITSLNIGNGVYSTTNIWPGSNASSFSLSSSASWLTIPSGATGTPSNFGGTYYLMPTIAATANTSASPRTANIIMSFPGTSTTKTLPITQTGKTPDVTLSKSVAMVSGAGGNDTTFITSDSTWTATKTQSWLTLNKATGKKIDTLVVTLAANAGSTVLLDTVKVKATGNTVSKFLVVRQNPAGATLKISRTTVNIAAAVSSSDTFKITTTGAWAVTSADSWLTPGVASGSGNAIITLSAAQLNSTGTPRSTTVTVNGGIIGTKTITVTQASAAPTLSVSDTVLNFTSTSGTMAITINSNSAWTISCPQSFVTLSSAAGAGYGMVLVKVPQNPFIPARNATITVSATGVTSKVIKVTQASVTPTLYIYPSKLGLNATVDSSSLWVNTNGTFTVSSDASWLTVSPATNSGIGIAGPIGMVFVKVKAATANPNTAVRTATVTVSVPGTQAQLFTYTQAANPNTGITDVSTVDDNIAYPNPVSNILYVSVSSLPATISLINIAGEQLLLINAKSSVNEIDMAKYKTGMYVLKITTSGKTTIKKIIKQ